MGGESGGYLLCNDLHYPGNIYFSLDDMLPFQWGKRLIRSCQFANLQYGWELEPKSRTSRF